ncbi:unnamed protein product [Trichobilharzia regenti]|uniref:TRAF-type domain-containing protein n=1 Tax=Trichobilharzia regenti TaxID=157069 RepID=A0A183W967_TRIRE|nr:unnamed protein product [Trichobilharzia regenti]VDQ04550.1 unnamed protein product [Trichobilharzia regenti]
MRRIRRSFSNTTSLNPRIHHRHEHDEDDNDESMLPHHQQQPHHRLDEDRRSTHRSSHNPHDSHHHHQHSNESNSSSLNISNTPVNNSILSDQSNEFSTQQQQLHHQQQHSVGSYTTDESYINLLNTLNNYNTATPTADDSNPPKYTHVIKAIREVISCCACYASDTLMKECMNGHLICQNCFLTLRQDERPQCPTCRASLYSDTRRALIAQKVLSELPDTCLDCKTSMLHKSLINHRLNLCPKRSVACGLSPFGCEWIGNAEQYQQKHQNECVTRKRLLEQPIGDYLDTLLHRFQTREQIMRETFQCFSTVLHHLEAHEIQTTSITLSSINITETDILYRSDYFHLNQSRWTIEALIKFLPEQTSTTDMNMNAAYRSDPSTIHLDLNLPSTNHTIEHPECSMDEDTDIPHQSQQHQQQQQEQEEEQPLLSSSTSSSSSIRRRRNHSSCLFTRHHPYQRSFGLAQNQTFTHTEQSETSVNDERIISPRVSPYISNSNWYGDITFRLIKENSSGIGRKAFSFVFLQLKVPESGVHIYARPQLHTYRFNVRGEHTPYYKILPIRWRYINNLREMIKHRLIQVEVVIARKISEDHTDN